jgi:hypothetical protein
MKVYGRWRLLTKYLLTKPDIYGRGQEKMNMRVCMNLKRLTNKLLRRAER